MIEAVEFMQGTVPIQEVVLQVEEALHLGMKFQQNGCLDEAEKLCRKIIDAFPYNPDALHLLAFICHRQDRHAEASELLGRYLRLCPEDAEAHNNLGNTMVLLGNVEEAEVCYRRAIALNPGHASAHKNLCMLLRKNGEKVPEATEVCRKTAELDQN